jgi:chaperonin GroES
MVAVILSVSCLELCRSICKNDSICSFGIFGTIFVRGKVQIKFYLSTKKLKIMSIKPLADRVLIKPADAEEKTAGGIIIPDSAKEKPLKGEVIAVGKGTKDEEMVLKEGDKVLYGKYAGTEIELDDVKYLIMRQSDVLAVI